MEEITKEDFEKADKLTPTMKDEVKLKELTEKEFQKLLVEMQSPVNFQKELAIKVKISLDNQMKIEMKKDGKLSESTRRWIESYNKILEKLQTAIHGDKSVNIHLHKVSHSDISMKIRESKKNKVVKILPNGQIEDSEDDEDEED